MTRAVELVFAVGWGVFGIAWLVAAFSTKRGQFAWGRQLRIRVILVVVILVLARLHVFRGHGVHVEAWGAAVGLALFALGVAFAVWARVTIGRNWGTPMTRKDDPELVTGGPYRFVRHPIYSGIIVALLGTAVALGWHWLIAFGLAAVYFVYSARMEERYLTARFPTEYPRYRESTKMLVPFLF